MALGYFGPYAVTKINCDEKSHKTLYIYIHTYIYVYIHIYMEVYIYIYIWRYIYTYEGAYIYMYIYIYDKAGLIFNTFDKSNQQTS